MKENKKETKTIKEKTFNVEFTTAFAGSSHVIIHLEAQDEKQAKRVARNLCRFGYISNVTQDKTPDYTFPTYTEDTHDWAYDEDFEIYS